MLKISKQIVVWGLLLSSSKLIAGVLPDERADLMVHAYDGGGLEVNGPALLVRKNIGSAVSVFYNTYQDNITSASIDVQISGSPYEEARTEQTLGVDYLNGKTTMNFSYTNSTENDYDANTLSFGISQDFFGDLTNLSIGFGYGEDAVSERVSNTPRTFQKRADIVRQNYRISLTQILTKNATVGLAFETITDEGTSAPGSTTTLNNPYRQYSYYNPGDPTRRLFADEIYPHTRTSNALAIRGNYFLEPFKSAIHADYRIFQDSWGVNSNTYSLTYVHPIGSFVTEFRYRFYDQDRADFYRDIFDFQNQFTYMARDKELSTFTSTGMGFSVSYEFAKNGWHFIDKGSLNFSYDLIHFDYADFRDATENLGASAVNAGEESLYAFDADVYQIFLSLWY